MLLSKLFNKVPVPAVHFLWVPAVHFLSVPAGTRTLKNRRSGIELRCIPSVGAG